MMAAMVSKIYKVLHDEMSLDFLLITKICKVY